MTGDILEIKDKKLLDYLRENSFFSARHKLLYIATPKVACTSLKWWFAHLEGISSDVILSADSAESDPDLVIHDALRKVTSGITGLSPSELQIPLISEKYFRFALVRNPYKRVFSAWQSKLLLREPLQGLPFVDCDFYNRQIKCTADIALAFEGFLEHIATLSEDFLDAHWKPQVSLLRPDIIAYSLINKIEEPEILDHALFKRVNADIQSPFNFAHKNESLIPYLREFVTDRSAELIQKLYAKDFIEFGYETKSPESKCEFSSEQLKIAIHGIHLVRGRNDRLGDIRSGLGKVLAERDNQIRSLGSKLEELGSKLEETNNNLEEVFSSRSWKVTRPLRIMNSLLIRIKKKARHYLNRVVISVKQNGVVATVHKIIRRLVRGSPVHFARPFPIDTPWDYQNALEETCKKKLTLIAMVKNEKSIIETFCGHALSMFDRIIIIDHGSTDGTKEYVEAIAKQFPAIECFLFDEPGYYQSELMTWVIKNLVDHQTPGWAFFLDADELLPFESKDEFYRALAKYNAFPVISMPWLNLVPLNMQSGAIIGEQFLKPNRFAAHHKIAFQLNLIPLDDYVVAQGSHALLVGTGYTQMFPAEQSFPIYHFPIRTKQQLQDKIIHGVESYRRMGKTRPKDQGIHWDEISELIETHGLTDELMLGMIAGYGEPMKPPYAKTLKEMTDDGYNVMRVNVSYLKPPIDFDDITFNQKDKADGAKSQTSKEQVAIKKWDRIVLNPESRVLRFE